MDQFPKWAKQWLEEGGKPVTRGLNLALKLQKPARLPLMLWDILVARPKIKKAMEELSFIHYARFAPSWDGTALMVITEFDGPLEPYVMDFVIALGDVFDVLLSYVDEDERPPLPVRENPDEFWCFVQKWNRVPFFPRAKDDAALFPADFEYPLYQAYAGQTVIDILGPRTTLLPPAIDHPADAVDLNDVQGNILRGYRSHAAGHLFLTITDPDKARIWLSTVLPDRQKELEKTNPWGGVMSAAPWGAELKTKDSGKPAVMTNIGFTYDGLTLLLPRRKKDLERFPTAFREGPARRKEINGDKGPSDPLHWRFGKLDQAIHVVLTVHTSLTPEDQRFKQAFNALVAGSGANGMREVHREWSEALKDADGNYFAGVYFGYHDGFAQPRIAGQCNQHKPDFQPAASPGEFLLGESYKSIFGGQSIGDLPRDLATNGTFGAMRLIEQHVALFEETVKKCAGEIGMKPEQFKAKLMGRWPYGEPLVPGEDDPRGVARNDFDYAPSWERPRLPNDHDGTTCPVGAHIRRANPRTARVAGQRNSRRLIRRGMPITWKENDGTVKQGLLGLFIGASLERQFEFIQREWLHGDLAASGIRGTQDPIAGVRTQNTKFKIDGHCEVEIPPMVTTRGSLYLFYPGIAMLRGLGRSKVPSAFDDLKARPAAGADPDPFVLTQVPKDVDDASLKSTFYNLRLRGLPDDVFEFLQDLLFNRVLNSEHVARLVEHFAPRPRVGPENEATPPEIQPLDPEFVANPYSGYAELRRQKRPIVWVREHGAYWVLDRDEVQRLLANNTDFVQQPSGTELRGLLTMDGERHLVVRKEVADAFKIAAKDARALTESYADAAIARLKGLDHFDFMTAYGAAVPRAVYWKIYGLAGDELAACDALARTMMQHFGQPPREGMADGIVSADAAVRLTGRLGLLLATSMIPFAGGAPKGTLVDEIAKRTSPFGRLTFFESLMTLVQLALVHMSSQFLLGTATRNLLLPDPRKKGLIPWYELANRRLSEDTGFEDALTLAVDEARRVDAPVTIVERFAARDLNSAEGIGGVAFKKDCAVFAVVASANRHGADADLEQYHWDRPAKLPHLSLGHGVHHCVGSWLQEQIVPTALTRIMEEVPDLRLADEGAVPAWYDNIYFRALQSLPVKRCP